MLRVQTQVQFGDIELLKVILERIITVSMTQVHSGAHITKRHFLLSIVVHNGDALDGGVGHQDVDGALLGTQVDLWNNEPLSLVLSMYFFFHFFGLLHCRQKHSAGDAGGER